MTWIKICGTTNLDDALLAVDAGADAVGFVFYEKSPRNISVDVAMEIVAKLPNSIEKVGVFVNEPTTKVSSVADEAGLTAVQFHGDEYQNPAQYSVRQRALFCLPATDMLRELRNRGGMWTLPEFPNLAALLLDSSTPESRGGTGRKFAWAEASPFVSALGKLHPVVIAGGLTPANVEWAVQFLKPWGVDVVSGVEAHPGKKDPEKVRAFVKAVRETDRKAS
jgi:phosphoribosylanthranilate isomerase